MATEFVLQKGVDRTFMLNRVASFLGALGQNVAWKITVEHFRKTRSDQQNRYLWGVAYATLLNAGGEMLGGWTADDLHTFFLGEHFGWETVEAFGKKRVRPIRRSSKLSTVEFAEYVAFVQQRAAEYGVFIPDPQ